MSDKGTGELFEIVPLAASEQVALDSGRAEPAPKPPEVVEAEWVRCYPARRRGHAWRWVALVLKLGLAFAATWLFVLLPVETLPTPLQNWKNPIIIFLLVCFVGKTLLDTLFYDHYQP